MKREEINEKAKTLGIKNYKKLKINEIIPAIQLAEGNADCFQKIENCQVEECCWRERCQE
jgi:hypothetical protein